MFMIKHINPIFLPKYSLFNTVRHGWTTLATLLKFSKYLRERKSVKFDSYLTELSSKWNNCQYIIIALLYWIQYISQKNLCTKLQVWMQPAKLLHVPKCTTLIWNMDVVCMYFFFFFSFLFALLCIYYLSHLFSLYSFLILFLLSFMLFLCSFTVLVPLSLLYLTIRTYKQIFGLFIYSALPISCGHFSPNNSRSTPIARSIGRDMDVILEFEVLPKFYIRNWRVGWNIVLYRDISRAYSTMYLNDILMSV